MKNASLSAIVRSLGLTLIALTSSPLLAENEGATPEQHGSTPGKSDTAHGRRSNLTTYALDANASGVITTINNIANLTVVSKDANALKAEYRAGFIQGKLQGKTILSARDNSWDNAYLTNPIPLYISFDVARSAYSHGEVHDPLESLPEAFRTGFTIALATEESAEAGDQSDGVV